MTNSKLWNQSEDVLRVHLQDYSNSKALSHKDQAIIADVAVKNMRNIIECIDVIHSDDTLKDQLETFHLCQQILDFNSNSTFLIQIEFYTKLINSLMKIEKYSFCFEEMKAAFVLILKHISYNEASAEITLHQLLIFLPLSSFLSDQEVYNVAQFVITVFKFANYSLLNNNAYPQISQKDFAQALESSSCMNSYVKFLSTKDQSAIAEMAQLLIQLSFSTKTGHKLVFLMISLRYGTYINQINEELLAKIISDCSKMMKRNAGVVYKLAAASFFDLLDAIDATSLDSFQLRPITLKFKESALKLNDSKLSWDTYLKVQDSIIPNMEKLELNESSITSHLEMKNYALLKNQKFLSLLFNKLKGSDFETGVHQIYVVSLLLFFENYYATLNTASDLKLASGFFDYILLKFKNLTLNSSNFQFVSQCLSLITSCCNRFPKEHKKKLSNLSSIYFTCASKVIAIDCDQANKWFKLCGQVEYVLFKVSQDQSRIIQKLNQISFFLINAEAKASALPFLVRAMELWYTSYQGTFLELESNSEMEMSTTMKLLAKASVEEDSISLIINNFKFSELSTAVLINICILLCNSGIENKEKVISKVILDAKQSFSDTGMFFYFLSRVTFIIDFDINFRCESFEFEPTSITFSFRNLIIAHIQSLEMTLNDSTPESLLDSLKNIYKLMIEWCVSRDTSMSDYEQDVLHTIITNFSFHKKNNWAIEILETYLKEKRLLTSEQQWKIRFLLARLYIITYNFESFKTLYKNNSVAMIQDPILKIEIMLCVLEADIRSGNSNVQDNIRTIFKHLEDNPSYSVSKQNDKYKVISLLFILAKFSHLISSYHELYTFDHIESICNLKREIKILQSIMKFFIIGNSKAPTLTVNFKCVLKLLFSEQIIACYISLTNILLNIGVCKEFEYYSNELELFTKQQPSFLLKTRHMIEFINHQIALTNKNKAQSYYDRFMEMYNKDDFQGDIFFNLRLLATKERFYAFIGDEVNAKSGAYEFDSYVDKLLSEQSGVGKNFLLESWTKVISRRLTNSCDRYDCSIWIKHFENSTDTYRAALCLYTKCYKAIQEHPKLVNIKQSSVSYPLSKFKYNKKPTMDLKLIVDILKKCEYTYCSTLNNHFKNLPMDILKMDIEKLTNCLVDLVRYDISMNSVEGNKVNWILSLNDRFKYQPFTYEKGLASIEYANNESLPNLTCLTKFAEPILNDQECILNKLLPKNWTCITIDYNQETDCIVLSKYQADYDEPIIFQLFVKRLSDCLPFANAYNQLHDIIKKSDHSTKPEVTNKISTREQKIEWWAQRNTLDSQLSELLASIESIWFGGFNSLFSKNRTETKIVKQLQTQVNSVICESLKEQNVDSAIVDKLMTILNSFDIRIFELLLNINEPTTEKVKDILVFLFDRTTIEISHQGKGILFNVDFISMQVLTLIKKTYQDFNKSDANISTSDQHIFIIPGPECVSVPWESIPSLRNKSSSRFPSVKHLVDSLKANKDLLLSGISSNKGYYVINPGGDLQRTEKNLGHQFKELHGWNGVIGHPPEEKDIVEGFKNYCLYVYAGHGGGEQYIRSSTLKKQERIPPALLFGCSSGQLKSKGSLSPYGTPYNYLMGNCPTLLVNLWDVTDKDTDLFTLSVLKSWGLLVDYSNVAEKFFEDSVSYTLGHCITEGRNTCKLKYLNGAAPVLYGLPLTLGGN